MKALLSAMLMKKMNDYVTLVNAIADTYDKMIVDTIRSEEENHE